MFFSNQFSFVLHRIIHYYEEMSEKLANEQNLSEPLTISTDAVTFRGQIVSNYFKLEMLLYCDALISWMILSRKMVSSFPCFKVEVVC